MSQEQSITQSQSQKNSFISSKKIYLGDFSKVANYFNSVRKNHIYNNIHFK